MKYVIALIVGLTGTLVLALPAVAQSASVPAPSERNAGPVVVISGRVHGKVRTIRIEQLRARRWVLLHKAAVRHGRYAVTVQRTAVVRYLRAGTPGHYSPVVTVPPTGPATSTDACGTVARKADGTAWSCTFHDEFDGTTLNPANWIPQTAFAMGTQSAHACFRDDPSNVNVAGGSLNLTVRSVTTPVTCDFGGMTGPTSYTSGGVMSYRLFSQKYGRFEARIKNTATPFPGLQETFWLWPDDRVASSDLWPTAGEMDVSETYSSYPTLSIPFLHYSADAYGAVPGLNTAWNCAAPRGAWNTYALEWTATMVRVIVNGRTCLTNTSGNAAFLKPYIMAFSQGLGAAGNVYDGRAPLPATMSIDYVRVWR